MFEIGYWTGRAWGVRDMRPKKYSPPIRTQKDIVAGENLEPGEFIEIRNDGKAYGAIKRPWKKP